MPALHPFSRGFLIHSAEARSAQEFDVAGIPAEWTSLELQGTGWTFSHDAALVPDQAANDEGDTWVLVHGLCLYAGDDDRAMTPAERLLDAVMESEDSFLDTLDDLGGRYVALLSRSGDVKLFQDAMGMRSVYFSADAQLVASHANLIQRLHPHPRRTSKEGAGNMIHAWSRTPFIGIDALLPNHSLGAGSMAVKRFFPRRPNQYLTTPIPERVNLFRAMWDRQMHQLIASDADLVMSLTGGSDSRTNLALSWRYRDELQLFTYTGKPQKNNWHRASYALDKTIVDKLLGIMPGARHQYFFIEDKSVPLDENQQATVTANSIVRHGGWLLPHYLRSFPGDNHVHLRGFGYEIGRAYWEVTAENSDVASIEGLFLRRMNRQKSSETKSSRLGYFRDGVRRWEYSDDMHGYHLRDLYYWEMRMGRWGSEIMNETDIAFETCVGMNTRRMFELSLAFPIQDRKSGFFFSEIINASYPMLNFFGKNDARNLYEITRDERREGPKSGKPGLKLRPELTVTRYNETVQVVSAQGARLQIPENRFESGTAGSRCFEAVQADGDLRFVLTSRYGRPNARHHWRYQVWVNDRMHRSWDGGVSNTPVHVNVTDLRAGDVVKVTAMVLRDQPGSRSWPEASRAELVDVTFEPKAPIATTAVSVDAPGATGPEQRTVLTVAPHDVPALSAREFALDKPTRLDIDLGRCVVPMLVVRRNPPGGLSDDGPRVITLFNGAVDLEKSQNKPVFQRSTWWEDFPWSQIYVADPGTIGEDALSLSWGQIDRDSWAIPEAAEAARHLAGLMGAASPRRRLYFGSSAGGFWAWAAAVLDPGSRAVVNNAQIDWTRWMAGAVNELRTARFDGLLPATIRDRYPERSSVLKLWKQMNKPARVDYWVNTSSGHDRVVDLPQVETFARQYPTLTEELRIHRYEDPVAGHNPMARADLLHVFNATDNDSAVSGEAAKRAAPVSPLETVEDLPVLTWDASDTPDFLGTPAAARHTIVGPSGTSLPVDAVLLRRDASDTLVVSLHGLVDRKKHGLPHFERFRELQDLPQHVLFLADPTLQASSSLRVGWYIGTSDDDVPERVAGIIRETARQLGLSRVVLTGASAGGFAALSLAPRIEGSLAVVFSPQTDIRLYANGGPAKALVNLVFKDHRTVSDLADEQPERLDLSALYGQQDGGRAWVIQNSGDEANMERHMRPFQDAVDDRVTFVLEHHCKGPNPPTPGRIRNWIEYACSHFNGTPQPNRLSTSHDDQS